METPGPVVNKEMTKSSNDIVNATNAPAKILPLICGMMTFHIACHGVQPRSIAASAIFGSSALNRGRMESMTYGIQKAICANNIVTYPVSIRMDENRSMNPIAVTISGLSIGRLLT